MNEGSGSYSHLWEVSVSAPAAVLDLLAAQLLALSPEGFQQREVCGGRTELVFYRDEDCSLGQTCSDISRQVLGRVHQIPALEEAEVSVRQVKVPDPLKAAVHRLRPLQIGPLLIIPSPDCSDGEQDAHPGPIVGQLADTAAVFVQPGMAFGTGHHASTRLALRGLLAVAQKPQEGDMLDIGCGSGILALSALRLGYNRAWACDINSDAVDIARRNSRKNDLSEDLDLFCGDIACGLPADWPGHYLAVAANINASVLRENAELLQRLTGPGGHIILSGLYGQQQLDEVYQKYCLEGEMSQVLHLQEAGWHASVLR